MRVLGSIVRGVDAGAFGTFAMDRFLFRRYADGGGRADFFAWESSEGLDSWEGAPASALAGKWLLERVGVHDVPVRYARVLSNVMHWGLGLASGAAYGLLVGSRKSRVGYGVPFGALVWASGYVVLPRLGVYKQIWEYDFDTLAQDLRAHLVFGTATATAFAMLNDLTNAKRWSR